MENEIIKHYLSQIMVTMPVEIVEVDNNTNLCSVKPLIYNELDFPVIVKCPFLPIGSKTKNIKFKVQKGQRFLALFSQLDLSNYIASGTIGQINSTKQFSFTNCVILPILALTELDGIKVPELDFEINGNVKMNGKLEIDGDIIQNTGNIKTNGKVEAKEDVLAETVSLKNHLTEGVTAGKDLSGKPKQ